jgi:hypothetical protein
MMNGAHVFVLCLQVDGPIVSWKFLSFKRFKKIVVCMKHGDMRFEMFYNVFYVMLMECN